MISNFVYKEVMYFYQIVIENLPNIHALIDEELTLLLILVTSKTCSKLKHYCID